MSSASQVSKFERKLCPIRLCALAWELRTLPLSQLDLFASEFVVSDFVVSDFVIGSVELLKSIHYLEFCIKFGSGKFRSHLLFILFTRSNKQFQTANSNMFNQMCYIIIWHASLLFFLCRKLRIRSFRIRYWIFRTAKLLAFLLSKNEHYLEFGMYKIWFSQIYYISCSPDPINNSKLQIPIMFTQI